ncbi:TPA: hypothetical protein ACFU1W_001190 [Neisseria oralis]|jgi:hypothetical protein
MEHSEQQPTQQTLAQQPRLLETPRRVKASQGVEWISQAWKIYRRNKIKWPAMFLVFLFAQWLGQGLFFLCLYVGISPSQQSNTSFSIFSILFLLAAPLLLFLGTWISMLFSGGIMYACNRSAIYGELKFSYLFAAFATKKRAFFIFLLLSIVVGIAIISFMAAFKSGMITTEPNPAASFLILLIAAVFIIFFISLWMSIWFATCLIMLHDVKPWAAMKMSFTACLRNIPAGIVNILMWIVIYIGLTVGIYTIAGIAGIVIGVFVLLFGETAPSFAGAGIVAFGIIVYYIVMILSALILAVLVIINIYTAYRNLLTDAPLEN